MKRIKLNDDITPFVHDTKLHGRGGTYVAQDNVATKWENEGIGVIIENVSDDYVPQSSIAKDPFFIQKLRDHLPELIDMLKEFGQKEQLKEEQEWIKKEQAKKDQAPNLSLVEDKPQEQVSTGTTEGSNQAASVENPDDAGEDQSEGSIDTSSVESDIPDDFPSRTILITNGIFSLADLKKMSREELLKLKGISERRANAIGVRLSEV